MNQPATTIEATDETFQEAILDASQEIPVLVDFWAPWCGPCKVIGPVLENLAAEMNGRFQLAKINVDENPGVAQAFRIQSIPAVMLFSQGTIKDQFMGAYPEPEIRKFLDNNLPSTGDLTAMDALQLWNAGQKTQAAQIFDEILASDPKNAVALLGQAYRAFDNGNTEAAESFVQQLNEADLDDLPERQQLEKMLAALKANMYLSGLAQNEDQSSPLAEKFTKACAHALSGEFQVALEGFLEVVKTDRKFADDGGRKGMIAVFDLLPADSELTADYRTKLSNILFS